MTSGRTMAAAVTAAARTGLAARAGAPGTRALVQRSRPSPAADTEGNGIVAPRFENRNPRNLERLALGQKDKGWQTTWPRRGFWHRLCVRRSQHHVTGRVEAAGGELVLSASTQEWAVKRHLYSCRDAAAAENVGRVLARRCLEAGLGYLTFRAVPWEYRTETIQRFCAAMKDSGVVLSEPRRVYRRE